MLRTFLPSFLAPPLLPPAGESSLLLRAHVIRLAHLYTSGYSPLITSVKPLLPHLQVPEIFGSHSTYHRIYVSVSLGHIPEVEWLGCMVGICLALPTHSKKKPNRFLKWFYHFILLPAVYESSICSTSLSTLGIVNLFDFSHFEEYVVVSYVV